MVPSLQNYPYDLPLIPPVVNNVIFHVVSQHLSLEQGRGGILWYSMGITISIKTSFSLNRFAMFIHVECVVTRFAEVAVHLLARAGGFLSCKEHLSPTYGACHLDCHDITTPIGAQTLLSCPFSIAIFLFPYDNI